MDAREALARGLAAKRHDTPWEELRPFTRACFRTLALTVERILHADGYQIIHRDENHGPTLERAAAVAENLGGTWTGSRDAFSCAQEAAVDDKCEEIAASIRAMGEKK